MAPVMFFIQAPTLLCKFCLSSEFLKREDGLKLDVVKFIDFPKLKWPLGMGAIVDSNTLFMFCGEIPPPDEDSTSCLNRKVYVVDLLSETGSESIPRDSHSALKQCLEDVHPKTMPRVMAYGERGHIIISGDPFFMHSRIHDFSYQVQNPNWCIQSTPFHTGDLFYHLVWGPYVFFELRRRKLYCLDMRSLEWHKYDEEMYKFPIIGQLRERGAPLPSFHSPYAMADLGHGIYIALTKLPGPWVHRFVLYKWDIDLKTFHDYRYLDELHEYFFSRKFDMTFHYLYRLPGDDVIVCISLFNTVMNVSTFRVRGFSEPPEMLGQSLDHCNIFDGVPDNQSYYCSYPRFIYHSEMH